MAAYDDRRSRRRRDDDGNEHRVGERHEARFGATRHRGPYGDDDMPSGGSIPHGRAYAGTGSMAGKGPEGDGQPDDRIRDNVRHRLAEDPELDGISVEVAVENGEVTLSGTVDTRAARRRAEELIRSVSGIRHLQNGLRVREHDGNRQSTVNTNVGPTS